MSKSSSSPDRLKPLPHVGSMEDDHIEIHSGKSLRWLGDDGANVFLEWQGTLFCMAIRRGPRIMPASKKRGKCTPFSAASRLRMLKMVNRLDWANAGRCTFATHTFPDRKGVPHFEEITRARSWFQRDLEAKIGRHQPGLWRIEWQIRKSGRYIGKLMPHLHVLYFSIPYINRWWWHEKWMQVINEKYYANTKVVGIKCLRQCMYYVAKYLGKMPSDEAIGLLGIGAYLNSGRPWGVYRREELPLAEGALIRVPPGRLIKEIRLIAERAWSDCPNSERQGFSLFGPASQEISALVEEYLAAPDAFR